MVNSWAVEALETNINNSKRITNDNINYLANRPVSRLQQLVASNHTRYLAKLEAERLASRAGRE